MRHSCRGPPYLEAAAIERDTPTLKKSSLLPCKRLADRLRARSGTGGTLRRTEAAGPRRAPPPAVSHKLRATSRRVNPPNTYFRKLFERGDLPIRVKHTSAGIRVEWLKPIDTLDLHELLPVFMSGMREVEEPYMSMSQYGTHDLLATGGDRVLPVVPQLVEPMREALVTRDPMILRRVLITMQKLATCGELVGEALVPFYRRLLPVLNVFKAKQREFTDCLCRAFLENAFARRFVPVPPPFAGLMWTTRRRQHW